jgi:hypothetical protein
MPKSSTDKVTHVRSVVQAEKRAREFSKLPADAVGIDDLGTSREAKQFRMKQQQHHRPVESTQMNPNNPRQFIRHDALGHYE